MGDEREPDTESTSIEDVLNGKDRARIDEAHREVIDDDPDAGDVDDEQG